MEKTLKKFKLFWFTGKVETIEGTDLSNDLHRAGHAKGATAVRALLDYHIDHYEEMKEKTREEKP